MQMTEVIDHPRPKHPRLQQGDVAGQRATATSQGRQPGPQRRVQPLHIRRIDHAQQDLRRGHDLLGRRPAAVGYPPRDFRDDFAGAVLDHLHDVQIRPHNQAGAARTPGAGRIAKDLQDSGWIVRQTIHRKQDGLPLPGSGADLLHNGRQQGGIPLGTDRAPHKQAREHAQGGRDPDWPVLGLDIQLIGLDLAEIYRARIDDRLLDGADVGAGLLLPVGDRAFIEIEGGNRRPARASQRRARSAR